MPALDDPQHELFAQLIASGSTRAEAYDAIRSEKAKAKTPEPSRGYLSKEGSVYLVKNRMVQQRIDELYRERIEQKLEAVRNTELTAESCIQRALVGWAKACHLDDIAGMNAHNRTLIELGGLFKQQGNALPVTFQMNLGSYGEKAGDGQ